MHAGKSLAIFAVFGALSACADADEARAVANVPDRVATNSPGVENAQTAMFNVAGDRSLLKLSGDVISTTPSSFTMKTGNQMVMVEMDDWDSFKEGRQLKAGDEVVVTGRVDQDSWEAKKIEASSVFVRNLGVSFQANGIDEEDLAAGLLLVDTTTAALGRVSAVEGTEMTVGGTTGPMRVDVSDLTVRPAVNVGDTVHAWGTIDNDPNEQPELQAEGIAVLSRDQTKTLGQS